MTLPSQSVHCPGIPVSGSPATGTRPQSPWWLSQHQSAPSLPPPGPAGCCVGLPPGAGLQLLHGQVCPLLQGTPGGFCRQGSHRGGARAGRCLHCPWLVTGQDPTLCPYRPVPPLRAGLLPVPHRHPSHLPPSYLQNGSFLPSLWMETRANFLASASLILYKTPFCSKTKCDLWCRIRRVPQRGSSRKSLRCEPGSVLRDRPVCRALAARWTGA